MKKSKLFLSKQTVCQLEKGEMVQMYGGSWEEECKLETGNDITCRCTVYPFDDCAARDTDDCGGPEPETFAGCHNWSMDHPCTETEDTCLR